MSNILDNIFINLRVIARIPPKGRICTTSPGQVQLDEKGYSTKMWRTLTRDSRDKSVKLLTGIANDITEISDNIISSLYFSRHYEKDRMSMFQVNENTKKCHQLKKLVRELTNSKPGLKNLLETYSKDIPIMSSIEEVEDKFNMQVEKIQKALDRINAKNSSDYQKIRPESRQSSKYQNNHSEEEDDSDDDEKSINLDPFE